MGALFDLRLLVSGNLKDDRLHPAIRRAAVWAPFAHAREPYSPGIAPVNTFFLSLYRVFYRVPAVKRKAKQRKNREDVQQVQMRVETEFLKRVDDRAQELRLNRTEYFLKLADADIQKGGEFGILPRLPPDKPVRYKISRREEGP